MDNCPELFSPSLQRLPPEIQTRIFSELITTSPGQSSIHAVLYTCKQFYHVALPLSVHTFRNTPEFPDSVEGTNRNVRFLRYVLITKPELAKHVKTLIVGYILSEDYEVDDEEMGKEGAEIEKMENGDIQNEENGEEEKPQEREELITPEELAVYKEKIQSGLSVEANQYSCAKWATGLKKRSNDAQMALILLCCPNIRALWYHELDNTANFHRLLRIAGMPSSTPGQAPLANLEHVYSETDTDADGMASWDEQTALLFALPRLRVYECTLASGHDEEPDAVFKSLPPKSSPVEEIMLRKSALNANSVKGMMAACKALKRFEFTHGVYFYESEKMTAGDIMQAVLPHKDTLEYLHVNMEDDWDKLWWQSPHETWYFGTDLRQMRAIKTLILGMQSLTGMLAGPPETAESDIPLHIEGAPRLAECLPDGIEHFQIHGCGKAILEQAEELLGIVERGERFKNLRHIRFLFNKESTNPDEVQLMLDSQDVELNIVFQDMENRRYDCASRFSVTDNEGEHLCSLIHRADIRQEWLETRGSDLDRSKVGA